MIILRILVVPLLVSIGCARQEPSKPQAPVLDPSPESDAPKVHARLVVQSHDPHQPQWVGVHFRMAEGWHIYWINPGEAGLPTSVELRGPQGTTFEDVVFPAPEQVESPGGVRSYGYHGEVVLLARMIPGDAAGPIEADVGWLVCREACMRGKDSVQGSLASLPAEPELIERFLRRVPKPLDQLPGARVGWEAGASDDLALLITPPQGQAIATFFEGPALELREAKQENGALRLRFRPPREGATGSSGVVQVGPDYYAWRIDLPQTTR